MPRTKLAANPYILAAKLGFSSDSTVNADNDDSFGRFSVDGDHSVSSFDCTGLGGEDDQSQDDSFNVQPVGPPARLLRVNQAEK